MSDVLRTEIRTLGVSNAVTSALTLCLSNTTKHQLGCAHSLEEWNVKVDL